MMSGEEDDQEITEEEVTEKDKFEKTTVEDVEGKIVNFFLGMFGGENDADEDEGDIEEVEEEGDEENVNSNKRKPFIKDGKLYGQDFDEIKVV